MNNKYKNSRKRKQGSGRKWSVNWQILVKQKNKSKSSQKYKRIEKSSHENRHWRKHSKGTEDISEEMQKSKIKMEG